MLRELGTFIYMIINIVSVVVRTAQTRARRNPEGSHKTQKFSERRNHHNKHSPNREIRKETM